MRKKLLAIFLSAALAGTPVLSVYGADFSSGSGTDTFSSGDFSEDTIADSDSGIFGADEAGAAETETTESGAEDVSSWKELPEDPAEISCLLENEEYEKAVTEEAPAAWFSFTPEKTGSYTLRVSLKQKEEAGAYQTAGAIPQEGGNTQQEEKDTIRIYAALFNAGNSQEPAAERELSRDPLCETLTAGETCYFRIYLAKETLEGESCCDGCFKVSITGSETEGTSDNSSAAEPDDLTGQVPTNTETPDVEISAAETSDAETPDAETPDVEISDAETPAAEPSDAETPDAETPDAETPDAETPDAEDPDAEIPDAENPDTETTPTPELPDPEISTPELSDPEESDTDLEAGYLLSDGEEELPDFSDNSGSGLKRGASLTYSYDSATKTLTVKGSGKMSDYDVSNRPSWDSYSSTAEKLVVEEGITSIGESAFYKFYYLKSVSLPDTLTEIGDGAFSYNYHLVEVNIPEKVTKIGQYAFQEADIPSITLPAALTSIGSLTFFDCKYLEEINVASGNTVYSSADGVLFNKKKTILYTYPMGKNDASYTIPSTVKKVNDYAFYYARPATINIPSSVTTLKAGAFAKSRITSFILPDSVTSAEDFMCQGCESLTSVKIGTGLKHLPYESFRLCTSLTDVDLGNGVTEFGLWVFQQCSALTTITLPKKMTVIERGSFEYCTALKTVNFPAGLTEIRETAFNGCTALKSVAFPDKLTTIGAQAFYDSGLTRVTLPKSVSYIGSQAFPDNAKITMNGNLQQQEDGTYLEAYNIPIKVSYDYTSAFQVLQMANKERKAAGLSTLKMDKDLLKAAMQRAAETAVYFSHTRPNGASCFTICSEKMYGENIAVGQMSASVAMNAWMNSAGHRANILNENFRCIGVGAVEVNGICYWVQCFGIDTASTASASQYSNKTAVTNVAAIPPASYTGSSTFYSVVLSGNSSLAYGKSGKVEMYINNTFTRVPVSSDYITYKSSDTSVCTVSTTGVVRAKGCGTAKITAYLKNGTKIYASLKVKVTGISLSNCTVRLSASKMTCTGTARCPSVSVKYGSTTLVKDTDYTLSAVNNINPGTATLTIKGKGRYSGTITKTFKIVMKTPALLKAVSAGYNKVTVSWKAVPGAQSYTLYYKGGSVTNWKSVKSGITGTSYTHTSSSTRPLQSGTTYTYTVRAVYGSTKSSYDTAGKTVVPVPAAPKLTGITSPSYNKLQITWDKVSGATGYYIYRKIDGKWKAIAKTTDTSYTHKNSTKYPVVTGTTYTYTVQAYRMVGTKKVLGNYDKTGIKGKAVLPAPVLNDLTAATDGLTLTWNSVSGASGYKIYRYDYETEAWTRIDATEKCSYTDKTIPAGTATAYRIRAYRTIGENNIHSTYSEINEGIWEETIPEEPIPEETSSEDSSLEELV